MPRFHITWGTGPRGRAVATTSCARSGYGSGRDITSPRCRPDGAGVRVSGQVLEPTEVPRGSDLANRDREFSFTAQAAVVASGGIGGNFDLVRQNWPAGWGSHAATHDRRRA